MGEALQELKLARYAMGTRFEAVLFGHRGAELRAAGEAALDEISHLSAQLDLFRPDSFLSFLNREAHGKAVRLDPDLYELIEDCLEVSLRSGGAFDLTVGPLMKAWGFHDEAPGRPVEAARRAALESVGWEAVLLEPEGLKVHYARPGMRLDFGGVAKGFALDRAVCILEEAGVQAGLLHGGTSTVKAFGAPPGGKPWKVGIEHPLQAGKLVKQARLENFALSVSAPRGRAFEQEGRSFGHVMDPRAGAPQQAALLCAVAAESAARADAWSTALLVGGETLLDEAEDLQVFLCVNEKEGEGAFVSSPRCDVFEDPADGSME
jgi:thiamine biosynthesis lipoprotein